MLRACVAAADESPALRNAVSLFGGELTGDGWETIVHSPGETDYRSSWLAGVGVSHEWPIFDPRLSLGLEGQLVRHFGEQTHWEVNAPVVLRYRALAPALPLSGAAFGLGLSYASERPEIEADRKGQAQRMLAYWMAEIEFGKPGWAALPFIRLHHRSDGYFIADFDTGSNAVVFGLRHRF